MTGSKSCEMKLTYSSKKLKLSMTIIQESDEAIWNTHYCLTYTWP